MTGQETSDGALVTSWTRVRRRLRSEYGEVAFENWLNRLDLANLSGDCLVLSAPSRFMRDWVAPRYGDRIRALWRLEDPSVKNVDIVVREAEAPNFRANGPTDAVMPVNSIPAGRSVDEEAVDYLVASGVGKLWKAVYRDETKAEEVAAEAEAFNGENYGQQVREQFLDEYRAAEELVVPEGYNFRPNDKDLADPNLMQRHAASLVRDKHRVGNWSGTGAGKTLSAILASRVTSSSLTVVCCPNSVVEGWSRDIQGTYPDSEMVTKTWNPW